MSRERKGARAVTAARRAEATAAIGQLAASIGHELRNPLAAIKNANAYLGKKLRAQGAEARMVQFSELIEKELDVCGKIIADLVDFARDRPLAPAPTPLRDLVDEVARSAPTSVTVRNEVAADLPLPILDKEQFRQVLHNLVHNASDAGARAVTVTAERVAGGRFRLTVVDDGPGIAPEVQDRMFEPLFTTKVKGTGLGLAIALGNVERHGGTIAVETAPDAGTTFVIEWPGRPPSLRRQPTQPPREEVAPE